MKQCIFKYFNVPLRHYVEISVVAKLYDDKNIKNV